MISGCSGFSDKFTENSTIIIVFSGLQNNPVVARHLLHVSTAPHTAFTATIGDRSCTRGPTNGSTEKACFVCGSRGWRSS
jgi:hypothetical protein